MMALSEHVYINKLPKVMKEHANTSHTSIKMKLTNVKRKVY